MTRIFKNDSIESKVLLGKFYGVKAIEFIVEEVITDSEDAVERSFSRKELKQIWDQSTSRIFKLRNNYSNYFSWNQYSLYSTNEEELNIYMNNEYYGSHHGGDAFSIRRCENFGELLEFAGDCTNERYFQHGNESYTINTTIIIKYKSGKITKSSRREEYCHVFGRTEERYTNWGKEADMVVSYVATNS